MSLQQQSIQELQANIPRMIASLPHMTPREAELLEAWATQDVCREFLEASSWDQWTASFKLNQTLQWRKELLDPTSNCTSPIKTTVGLPGLQAAYTC
ncbi:hypothetical protein HDU98_012209 [Podochytrium sp. JEL0797]|nr:hypothetical protein HDU98_012209 [Podochytrium sp. JEL0797]